MGLRALVHRVRSILPEGRPLPEQAWRSRHNFIVSLLWIHVPIVLIFALAQGFGLEHGLLEMSAVVAPAILATWEAGGEHSRKIRASLAGLGLITSSAVLTHLSGGYIEMHFHFFVVIAILSLYQDWVLFLLAILYVAAHHGIVGVLDPTSVYNHPDAIAHPWKWAGIHAFFVLCASAAGVILWRHNEDARARSEQILTSAGEGIVGLDREGRVTFVNPSASQMTGYAAQELVGRDIHSVLRHRDPAGVGGERLDCALYAGSRAEIGNEDLFGRRDASQFTADWTSTPLLERGAHTGSVLTFRDVSDRKRREDELRTTSSLLSATLESTADGILVVDTAGKITSLNRRFAQMWRIPDEILAAKNDDQAIEFVLSQLKDPQAFVAKVRELYANHEAESFDTLEFKDGRTFERYSKPQRVDGRPVGRVWSFRDVTEQRRAEQQERRSLERAQEIERLQELNKFKSSFINMAAHELGTPLTPIRVQLHMLRERAADHLQNGERKAVDVIDRNVTRLAQFVQDMLEAARLQSGRIELRKTPAEMRIVLQEAFDTYQGAAQNAGITLALDAPESLPIEGDPNRLLQVVYNLVSNAIKFTPENGRVTISARSAGTEVVVRVKDTGTGLSPRQISRLFEPFSQVHDASIKSFGGTGLGLYLSRGIVELHGGRIWCESDGPGHGSTFSFAVPVLGPPDAPSPRTPPVHVESPTIIPPPADRVASAT